MWLADTLYTDMAHGRCWTVAASFMASRERWWSYLLCERILALSTEVKEGFNIGVGIAIQADGAEVRNGDPGVIPWCIVPQVATYGARRTR